MAAGDETLVYGTEASITITLSGGLADNAARECTAVSNEAAADKWTDVELYLQIAGPTSTPTGEQAAWIWGYASHDGTDFDSPATGIDAAITLTPPHNLVRIATINIITASTTYKKIITSLGLVFGHIPARWGFVLENKTGFTLPTTGHAFSYRPVRRNISA